jgi:26S proteasome regulatory subunit N1
MAKEDEKKPTAAEKGKGKAPVNGDAEKDAKTGKDGKVDAEDKKGVATATGMFVWPAGQVQQRAIVSGS